VCGAESTIYLIDVKQNPTALLLLPFFLRVVIHKSIRKSSWMSFLLKVETQRGQTSEIM
jgi:hypothetical protein